MRWVACGLVAGILAACGSSDKVDETGDVDGVDLDGDGAPAEVDCDDGDPEVFPGAVEVCDGIDNNCSGHIDEADPALDESTATTFYEDADADGHGAATQTRRACRAPAGFVATNTDCLDSDPAVSPDATEVCNGIDDDCDDQVDDADDSLDTSTGVEAYVDADGDGHGDPEQPVVRVCAVGEGTAAVADDCDDSTAERAPDLEEVCGDGLDNDCSGDDRGCGLHIRADSTQAQLTFTTGTQVGLGLGERLLIYDEDRDGEEDLVLFAVGFSSGSAPGRAGYRYVAHGPLSAGTVDIDVHAEDESLWVSDALALSEVAVNVGDLDGDGWDERVYCSADQLTVESGAGDLQVVLAVDNVYSIHPVGDLDGDGRAELVLGDPRRTNPSLGQGALAVVPGSATLLDELAAAESIFDGEAAFAGATEILSTAYEADWSVQMVGPEDSVMALDWDADGLQDLVVGAAAQGSSAMGAVRLVRDAASLPTEAVLYSDLSSEVWTGYDDYSYFEEELATGDLNNDGYDDLVATETFVGGAIYVLFGQTESVSSGPAWEERDVLITGSEAGGEGELGRRVTVVDLDGDGDLDLLATDPIAPPTSADALLGFLSLDTEATMGHSDAEVRIDSAAITGQCSAVRPLAADLSGDGRVDLAVGCVAEPLGGQVHLFFGSEG